jgi:hypothetical protein
MQFLNRSLLKMVSRQGHLPHTSPQITPHCYAIHSMFKDMKLKATILTTEKSEAHKYCHGVTHKKPTFKSLDFSCFVGCAASCAPLYPWRFLEWHVWFNQQQRNPPLLTTWMKTVGKFVQDTGHVAGFQQTGGCSAVSPLICSLSRITSKNNTSPTSR